MKKVLIVITTAFVEYGGLTTVVMNYLRAMSKEGLIIDIASNNEADKTLIDEVSAWGGHYYNLGKRKNIVAYRSNLKKVLRAKRYDVIHVHGNSSTMVLELSIAKECKITTRIAHLHNSQSSYPLIHQMLHPVFKKQYTVALAVSEKAGDWLYGKGNYQIMNNAINTDKYCFDSISRTNVRNELDVNKKIVIGTVGKLNYQKNQTYLLKVFAELCKKSNRYLLMIVGGGTLESALKQQAIDLGIEDNVLFLGMRTNANEIIQAFDYFVFPSIFEGLGMVLIEAQASGLPCIASDSIPRETEVSGLIRYMSLNKSPADWAEEIETFSFEDDRKKRSDDACKSIREHGYDIAYEADKLRLLYTKE